MSDVKRCAGEKNIGHSNVGAVHLSFVGRSLCPLCDDESKRRDSARIAEGLCERIGPFIRLARRFLFARPERLETTNIDLIEMLADSVLAALGSFRDRERDRERDRARKNKRGKLDAGSSLARGFLVQRESGSTT